MDRYKPRVTSRDSQEPLLASKGASKALSVNYGDIEDAIARLRRHHDLPVGDAKVVDDVRAVKSLAETLHGTEGYETFYALIVRHFGSLGTKGLVPGTVGAFAYGCNSVRTALSGLHPSCSAICVGGIPPPKLQHWASCSHNVVLMHLDYPDSNLDVEQRTFQVLNHSRTSTHTYIFVLRSDNSKSDTTFVMEDADFEHANVPNTKTYQVFLYAGGKHIAMGGTVTRATDESELTPIPTNTAMTTDDAAPLMYARGSSNRGDLHVHENRDSSRGIWWVALIVLIVVIILLLGLAATMSKRAKRPSS